MSIFYRSVIKELHSNTSVVFSTLVIIWIGVLLVRLLAEAAGGGIGADAVYGMVIFSTVDKLSVILALSTFVGTLTTITRIFRESEMVVWMGSGKSLSGWLFPVASYAFFPMVLVAILSFWVAPYTRSEVDSYRVRYEQRSDLSRIAPSQFWESGKEDRVFYAESVDPATGQIDNVFVRARDPKTGTLSIITADNAKIENFNGADRFLVLSEGRRYDITPQQSAFEFIQFERYGLRMEDKDAFSDTSKDRTYKGTSHKIQSTTQLLEASDPKAFAELLWRIGLPILTMNLALIAIPLGAVNPRLGKSGDLILAVVVALLYLNILGLMQSWVANENISFFTGTSALHIVVFVITLLWIQWRMRVKR